MPTIKRTFAKFPLREQRSDFAYWQSQPFEKRLEALEQIEDREAEAALVADLKTRRRVKPLPLAEVLARHGAVG